MLFYDNQVGTLSDMRLTEMRLEAEANEVCLLENITHCEFDLTSFPFRQKVGYVQECIKPPSKGMPMDLIIIMLPQKYQVSDLHPHYFDLLYKIIRYLPRHQKVYNASLSENFPMSTSKLIKGRKVKKMYGTDKRLTSP